MKKHYHRMKQLADQVIFCADKGEIFDTGDLQLADYRTQYLEKAVSIIINTLPRLDQDEEKTVRNTLESQLESVFLEHSAMANNEECPNQLFRNILSKCAVIESNLTQLQVDQLRKLKDLVGVPIQKELGSRFVTIAKHKRKVANCILDHNASNGQKYDTGRKLEKNRNVLSCEMFNLLAMESELTGHMLKILKLQQRYHQSAFDYLNSAIPVLEQYINNWDYGSEYQNGSNGV